MAKNNELLRRGKTHPITDVSSLVKDWLVGHNILELDLPESFLNDFGGDLERVCQATGISDVKEQQ
jgi:hypothetical protein